MSRIVAGNNLTIDTDAERWRLLANGDGSERVLVEAASGQPLRYLPTFGSRRKLPDTGALPISYIQRVVLGWSLKDESWHLGLVLEPELAEPRGSRWCEMVQWHDPQRDSYLNDATRAAIELAQTIARPFDFIEPTDEPLPPAPPPAPRPAPLPALPVTLDLWKFEQLTPTRLQFTLSSAWSRAKLTRIVWYAFWMVVYIVLSVTTLTGAIALPKPEFLPYLGLASAALLLVLIVYLIYQVLTVVNRIVVDAETRTIRALHGTRERWTHNAGDLQGIYVSHVVSRKKKQDKRTIHYGELNLLLTSGRFRYLLENGQVEEKSIAFDAAPAGEQVLPLSPELIETGMQTAAAHVARALQLPCWYDQRLK